MADVKPITVLHLSDMQFGKNHCFGVAVGPEGNNPYDTLRERLILDLRQLREDHVLVPDLMILTGDLAEWGRTAEFGAVLDLIQGLETELKLSRDRTIVIPGNHDINRNACEAYFNECAADDIEPSKPYWPKWKHYAQFFSQLYVDRPNYAFGQTEPWTLFEIEALKVVIAGLNSTIAESHKDKDEKGAFGHYGWMGERQCRWFEDKLRSYEKNGWLRIGAVHHNVVRGPTLDEENLRDADDLKRILGPHLNCVLHGHTHEADISFWIDRNAPTLSTGSAAVDRKARPEEVPNQYQILQFWPDRMVRYSRAYDPGGKSWIADARIGRSEVPGRQTEEVGFRSVGATFPPTTDSAPPISADKGRETRLDPFDLGRRDERRDDFLSRLEQICRLRSPENTEIERIDAQPMPYLRVTERQFGIATSYPLGGSDLSPTRDALDQFVSIHESYRRADPGVRSTFVQGGGCDRELAEAAKKRGIRLVSFVEYQGLIDFSRYLEDQTRRLEQDSVYPPSLYVPQRMRMEIGFDRRESDDALVTVKQMMAEPHGRFVLVLGDFGTGKTFLLRELARRMAADGAPVAPVLVEMRALEKGRTLDELIAQHLVRQGIEPKIKRFRHMLKNGRIALLFDGFDELALRVTYANATDHLKTVIEAADGEGKVVVTSRTQHFVSDHQVKTVLGQQVDSVPGQRIVRLCPFDEPQIRLFLRKRLGDDGSANARFDLIDKVKDLLGLSKNPRMLSFIADLPEQDLLAAKDAKGEISAASLYQKILDHWLDGEIERVTPKGSAPSLDKADLPGWRHPGLGVFRQHRAAVGGGERPRAAHPRRPSEWGHERGVQPGWRHPRLGICRQNRAAVGGGERPRTAHPRRSSGSGLERGVQPGWRHPGLGVCRQNRAAVGGGERPAAAYPRRPSGSGLERGVSARTAPPWPRRLSTTPCGCGRRRAAAVSRC